MFRPQLSRVVVSYAVSALAHAAVLGGLVIWMPDHFTGTTFSMVRGNGGFGSEWAPIGSIGGATTSEIFYFEMPAISAAEMVEYKARVFSKLPAQAQESQVTTLTPVVSALAATRQQRAEQFVDADRPTRTDELSAQAQPTSSEIDRKRPEATPETTEPMDKPVEIAVARNIAVAPAVEGVAVVAELPEKVQEGETTTENTEAADTKVTRRKQTEQTIAAAPQPTTIEQPEAQSKPTSVEIQRKRENSTAEPNTTAPQETPSDLPVVRSIAAAPVTGEVDVELSAVSASNGRGEDGLGTGNTQGRGNGGARGKIGGDFESPGIGPNNPSFVYPPELDQAGIVGTVKLRVRISAEGTVESVEVDVSSGWKAFDDSAVTTMRKWRFAPARRNGVPVATEIKIPVDYWYRRR